MPASAEQFSTEQLQALAEDYDAYIAEMTAQLNALDAASFAPDLLQLDALIASLEAEYRLP